MLDGYIPSPGPNYPQNPNRTDKDSLRQGKWTIMYDKDWQPTTEKENTTFYRLITYQNDKPVGKVYDMYASGKVQMEATLLADRPQDVMQGQTTFYTEDGKKQKMQVFEKGVLMDENIFDENGNLVAENWKLLDSLGTQYNQQKDYAKASEMWERAKLKAAIEFGKKHENYVQTLENLGILNLDARNYPTAEVYLLEAVDILKAIDNKNARYANLLRDLARTYNAMNKYTQAETLFLEVLAIYKQTIGENHIDYAKVMRALGITYYFMPDYQKSEQCLLAAKNINEKLGNQETLDYAYILTSLGNLYRFTQRYAEAEPIMRASLLILKKFNDPFYASALSNLALLYRGQGYLSQAITTSLEVLAIQKERFGLQHPTYARALFTLASLYIDAYNYSKVEPLLLEAMEVQRASIGIRHPDYFESLQTLAIYYEAIGSFEKAEPLYRQILAGRKEVLGTKHPQYAYTLNLLGVFYLQKTDDFSTAEPLLLEAIQIIKLAFGENSADYGNFLSNLGIMYLEIGNYEKAEEILSKSLAILQKSLGENHYHCARVMSSLGNLYQIVESPKAEIMLSQAVEINYKVFGENSNEYAYSMSNLGVYYELNTQDYLKADSLFRQALAIQKETVGEQNDDYLKTQVNLASTKRKSGFFKEAEALVLRNIQLWEAAYGKNVPEYSKSIDFLGRIYYIDGEYEKAVPYFKESSKLLMDLWDKKYPILSQKEKQFFIKTMTERFETYYTFTYDALAKNLNFTDWIYNNTLFTKGILFNNQNKLRNRILSSGDTTLQNLYQSWQSQRNVLAQAYQMSNEEKEQKGIEEAQIEEDINQLEKALSRKSTLFAQNDNKRYTWQDVQSKLKNGEAAIEIIEFRTLYDEDYTDSVYYAALLITPKTKDRPEMIVMENGNDLEGKYLRNYQNSIKFKRTDKLSYPQYWQKIAEKLKKAKIKKVYFSPDGVYNKINLITLQNPQTNDYVADEVEIQIVSNTKDIIAMQAESQVVLQNGVLIGYPNYNSPLSSEESEPSEALGLRSPSESLGLSMDSTQRFFDGSTVSELPGTKIEVENIQSIFNKNQIKVQSYIAQDASEKLIKSLQNPQILHIATHGFFLQNVMQESNEGSRDFIGMENQKLAKNPLLRSGLLFAGAAEVLNGKAKEGILMAFEAMNLNLEKTELVVMSACETGLGEISNGEGVYGLQRAFQVAGAKSVLMSLWTVSDEATKDLMILFYDNWLSKRQNKRIAFINAQKELRKKYPEPFFWGAFVMVGE
ncbi:MAG: tetratricopeptide repeat protein [Microscillaceae bacterium]|nr:tetratricopeptide repeat protein [Microscillaceae bacterium]